MTDVHTNCKVWQLQDNVFALLRKCSIGAAQLAAASCKQSIGTVSGYKRRHESSLKGKINGFETSVDPS
jgi:hypothetical protein